MFSNSNKGYVGKSRSVKSLEGIESYEVPLSLINKDLIERFLEESSRSLNRNYVSKLLSQAVNLAV